MDTKKVALIIGLSILIPLFLFLFVDAVHTRPAYEDFCKYDSMYKPSPANCTYNYGVDYDSCLREGGSPNFSYDDNDCEVFNGCNFCNKEYTEASEKYDLVIFLILAPIGLLLIILGLYLRTDYLSSGAMFAGIITLFYSTVAYLSSMSKLLRALVIFVELVVILWIGHKKIGSSKKSSQKERKHKKK